MFDEFFQKPERRHQKDLNIVPILDMLVTIIFFLLTTAGFLEFTKLTVPPSATTVASPSKPEPPLAPKIFVVNSGSGVRLVMVWAGRNPGQKSANIQSTDPEDRRLKLLENAKKFTSEFTKTYPGEKTIQIGLGSRVAYQELITVMDGVRDLMPDMVLISYGEAEARTGGGA